MPHRHSGIYIGLGANLPADGYESPKETLEAALLHLNRGSEINVTAVSSWYESAPVPISDQPWYVNGVAELETDLAPQDVLAALHDVEEMFGRIRRVRNEARVLDMDLLVYGDRRLDEPGGIRVPHPRLAERAFVILPLRDLAPDWVHPVSGEGIDVLVARLPTDQIIRRLDSAPVT